MKLAKPFSQLSKDALLSVLLTSQLGRKMAQMDKMEGRRGKRSLNLLFFLWLAVHSNIPAFLPNTPDINDVI